MGEIPKGLIAGDVGFSADDGWLSGSIRWFESLWTSSAKWSHTFGCIGAGECVESLEVIKRTELAKRFADPKVRLKFYRLPLNDSERRMFRDALIKKVGGAYAWLKYPLFVADAATSSVLRLFSKDKSKACFWFTSTFGVTNIPVCSELVAWALQKHTSYRLKDAAGKAVDWRIVSPDYFDDLLQLPINGAEVVC